MLTEADDALWRRDWIDDHRINSAPPLFRIVVAIDPAISTKSNSSETGILVVGADSQQNVYVLHDGSGRLSPHSWARRAIELMDDFKAIRIVAEANNGGDLVKHTIKAAAPERSIHFRAVRASEGKRPRSEPVAALYEQGQVHHVGSMPELEDQMCTGTPSSGYSPDRMDALVWAITDLVITRHELKIWV